MDTPHSTTHKLAVLKILSCDECQAELKNKGWLNTKNVDDATIERMVRRFLAEAREADYVASMRAALAAVEKEEEGEE